MSGVGDDAAYLAERWRNLVRLPGLSGPLEQRVEALGVEPVVLGPVAHDELPALVASAGVFALPSTKEGFGLAAMEALAAGVPVVVSNLPVLREIYSGAARFAEDPEELAAHLLTGLADPDRVRGRPARRSLGAIPGQQPPNVTLTSTNASNPVCPSLLSVCPARMPACPAIGARS